MPVIDALRMLHGSAAVSGPVTSTAKAITSGTIAGTTLTLTTGSTGSPCVGDLVSGTGVSANTYITAILTVTAVLGVGTYTVSVSQAVGPVAMTFSPPLLGDTISVGATSAYSNLELDFGAPASGATYPFLPEFPSATEKGYTFPPEVVGDGGVQMGVHILVTGPFYGNATATCQVDVCSNATTAATSAIATRTFTVSQLRVQGAHYWIPVPLVAVLEFLRFNWTNNTGYTYVGSIVSWFGPKTGGEQ
jgi:hypothetical protein